MHFSHASASLGVIAIAALWSSSGSAQPSAPNDVAPASNDRPAQTGPRSEVSTTGEIVVTAFRRSETVLKLPAAITAIQGGDLKTRGVNTVADLQNLAPGVNISTSQDGV